jgi:cytoskeletal protein CcmA (bactofilin family)
MTKFKKQSAHTVIGADAVIKGDITLNGGLVVYGKIFGDISTDGPVRIARSGAVYGHIRGSDIHIGGRVEGNVTVANRAVLGSESVLKGDLVYQRLLIQEGARFEGQCDLSEALATEESPPQEAPESESTQMGDNLNG